MEVLKIQLFRTEYRKIVISVITSYVVCESLFISSPCLIVSTYRHIGANKVEVDENTEMLSFLASTALAGITVLYIGLRLLQCWTQSPYEPPVVDGGIPFIGSILHMMRYKTEFYLRMK